MALLRDFKRLAPAFAIGLALSLALAGAAEARRGGGFGSRGTRTYQAPPATSLSPGATAPITRSMTPPPRPAMTQPLLGQPQRGGFFGRFGGGLLGGLLLGGLIGGLMGHGFGGAGLLTMLIQAAVIVLLIALVMRVLRRRTPLAAGAAPASGFLGQPVAGFPQPAPTPILGPSGPLPIAGDIRIDQQDMDTFARLLIEVQEAFARENYPALRAITTPEVMSFLAEELSQNAIKGIKNDVSATRVIAQTLAEAWREPDAEYATVVMQFEGIDVMRDRQTGQVVDGDMLHPTQTTEIWTFCRKPEGSQPPVWKLSAIQEPEPS
jgi:predicted lipid-binding transport protein (Tim44 family)